MDFELVVFVLKDWFFVLAVLATPAVAQTSPKNSPLPSQAKEVHGVAVTGAERDIPFSRSIPDANWRAVKRPEVARWKSHGDQAQSLLCLES